MSGSIESVKSNLARVRALGTAHRIAADYGITIDAMLGPCRYRSVVLARHRLWAVIRATLNLSYPDIGRLFGVDHSSVIHGVRKAEKSLVVVLPEHEVGSSKKAVA